jgi:hypothetical protein
MRTRPPIDWLGLVLFAFLLLVFFIGYQLYS